MKIVHVLPALTKGGGERVAAELANHAASEGHQVTLIAAHPVDPALLRDALHENLKVLHVSKTRSRVLVRYLVMLPWLWRQRHWLMQQDVIHCHLTYAAVFGTLLRLWQTTTGAKSPVIVETCHFVGAPTSRFRRWFAACMAVQRDAFVLIADDKFWSAFSLSHPKLITSVIPNGVVNPARNPVSEAHKLAYRREIGVPDQCGLVVGAVGRLEADRRPWAYLPVFAQIARECGPDVHFVLAGGGAALDRMKTGVVEHRLEGRVHLPGMVLDPALPLSIMDLYIGINVGAITGLAGMEAALTGVPVVAMQWVDGYQSTADDWIWSSSDGAEVAQRACELLRSSVARKTLAAKQKSHVELHRTVEIMAQAYYAVYQAALVKRNLGQ